MKNEIAIAGPMFGPTLKVLDDTYTTHKLWQAPDREAALASLGHISALATSGRSGADGALMDAFPKLKVIAHFGVGVDTVDVAAAKKRGITVTNTPDVLTDDVADIALALLLATVRRVVVGDQYVRNGEWVAKGPMALTGSVQYGKTAGILGLGRIGKAIAKRCEAFNLKIAYQGRRRQPGVAYDYYADPVALAKASDFLIAACPGGEATKGIVNRAVLDALGPEGVFVNIARGSVVDEPALLAALQEKRLGGAGLDVFADEPRVPEAFFKLDSVVLQPHVASATVQTRTAMGQLVIDNLAAHFAGQPLKTPYQE